MADRRTERIANLRDALLHQNLDALLITSLPNIRYLSGFTGSSALLLVSQTDIFLFTDFRYETQVSEEVWPGTNVRIEPRSLWEGLWEALPRAALGTIGFESHHLLYRDFQRLVDEGKRWQWRPAADLVESLREQKDDDEVQAIQDAVDVAVHALSRTLEEVRPGITELAVTGILELELRRGGSEGFAFPTIVASGPRSALPHARSSPRELRTGDLLLIDFGAVVRGYCSDITRTVVLGRADERQRELHGVVREANAIAAGGLRPGMSGRDADALARDYIHLLGYGKLFGHSLGHGIGLEVHEAPRLGRTSDSTLAQGAVVTIEPGIYVPDWGGIRVEDDVLLQAGGARVLTDFPRDLLELT